MLKQSLISLRLVSAYQSYELLSTNRTAITNRIAVSDCFSSPNSHNPRLGHSIPMRRSAILLVIALAFCSVSRSEEPVDVTVCKLIANPDVYNHKLVRVT